MPPYQMGARLTADEVELVRRWIEQGAPWPEDATAAEAAGPAAPPLPDGPFIVHSYAVPDIRVVPLAKGLSHPWSLAFLPGGDLLITERKGSLRRVHNGELLPEPVSGMPTDIKASGLMGLMEVAAHPQFEQNHYVYLTYTRELPGHSGAIALVRGRLTDGGLTDLQDLVVVEPWTSTGAGNELIQLLGNFTGGARLAFAPDGKLFMGVGGAFGVELPDGSTSFAGVARLAQDPQSLIGKVLRLNDNGSVPDDNPFVGQAGYRPEIFTLGHRNPQGLAIHPVTGQVFESEHGPQGGDEVNALQPGGNYGWPAVSYGRDYGGERISPRFWAEGMLEPTVLWVPSVAPSGLTFYTGDAFPQWQGNLFSGALLVGRIPLTGHLERIVFNDRGEETARESLLVEQHQRIRDVRQGPDGLLYLLTEEINGALLRLEPVD